MIKYIWTKTSFNIKRCGTLSRSARSKLFFADRYFEYVAKCPKV